ncbi:MAG: type II secretion system F family protein [Halobacteriota archaeon]|uniref:type II secretion system F family protein n=1 Tax=Natronomonas sp. TaxID=2184060 RepID=UPI00397489D6
MLRLLPLALVLVVLSVLVAAAFNERVGAWFARVAFAAFGDRTSDDIGRGRQLRSASIGTPYREYAATTSLYAWAVGICGSIVGIYVGTAIVSIEPTLRVGGDLLSGLGGRPDTAALEGREIALILAFAALAGGVAGSAARALRWRIPSIRADARRRRIEAGLPRMIAFTYALTRGGMSFPGVLRTISANERVFGESASEVTVAVRNIDLFNVDLVTAVQNLSEDTPSEQFGTFTENLSSVLQSGGNVSEFLRKQYERHREEAEDQQAEILNVLATTAEVYVTVIVAGMLFLVTILLIIGLTAGDTLRIIRVLTYVVIPAANVLFLAYLLDVTRPLRTSGDPRNRVDTGSGSSHVRTIETDGGYTRSESQINHGRLNSYRRLRSVRETLGSPLESLVARPHLVLYVTIPIVLIATAIRLPAVVVDGTIDGRMLDDLLVQAAIALIGTFAIVYEYSKRRLRRLEAALPDLLERLASLNESGTSIVSSLDRVRRSDIGALDAEVDRIWRDVRWGATAERALLRFESRVRTPSITRVVTLITNAMHASNEIGPVLRIAAEQARSDLQLRRQRAQEMFTYLVVVYVSFLVFLVVIAALEFVLIPSLPDMSALGEGASAMPIAGFGGTDRDAYRLAFFHTALIQSGLSGLVAGVMGSGAIEDGLKHAAIMLSITYVVLALLA